MLSFELRMVFRMVWKLFVVISSDAGVVVEYGRYGIREVCVDDCSSKIFDQTNRAACGERARKEVEERIELPALYRGRPFETKPQDQISETKRRPRARQRSRKVSIRS